MSPTNWTEARAHRTVDLRSAAAEHYSVSDRDHALPGWRARLRGEKPTRCRGCHAALSKGFARKNNNLCGGCRMARGLEIVPHAVSYAEVGQVKHGRMT